jgi:hypothetical protein
MRRPLLARLAPFPCCMPACMCFEAPCGYLELPLELPPAKRLLPDGHAAWHTLTSHMLRGNAVLCAECGQPGCKLCTMHPFVNPPSHIAHRAPALHATPLWLVGCTSPPCRLSGVSVWVSNSTVLYSGLSCGKDLAANGKRTEVTAHCPNNLPNIQYVVIQKPSSTAVILSAAEVQVYAGCKCLVCCAVTTAGKRHHRLPPHMAPAPSVGSVAYAARHAQRAKCHGINMGVAYSYVPACCCSLRCAGWLPRAVAVDGCQLDSVSLSRDCRISF